MNTNKEEELYCHYSDLPSPMAYAKSVCTDYDGMGNHGRFTKKKSNTNIYEKIYTKNISILELCKTKK